MRKVAKYQATAYPYSREFAPYLSHGDLLYGNVDTEIVNLVSPPGYGYAGQDAGFADQRQMLHRSVYTDLAAALESSNAILLLEQRNLPLPKTELVDVAKEAIRHGKHLLLTITLSMDEEEYLRTLCREHDVDYIDFHRCQHSTSISRRPRKLGEELEHLPIPIIAIGESLADLNGTDLTLAMTTFFSQQGYMTLPLIAEPLSCLVCRHSLAEILYDDRFNALDKVIQLNRWMMEIYRAENPDLIVLQLPGDLFALNNRVLTTHGLHTYILSQAFGFDAFALCVPYGLCDGSGLKELGQLLHYRFGLSPDAVLVSNKLMDAATLSRKYAPAYIHLPIEKAGAYIQSTQKECALPLHSMEDLPAICERMKNALVQYGLSDPVI